MDETPKLTRGALHQLGPTCTSMHVPCHSHARSALGAGLSFPVCRCRVPYRFNGPRCPFCCCCPGARFLTAHPAPGHGQSRSTVGLEQARRPIGRRRVGARSLWAWHCAGLLGLGGGRAPACLELRVRRAARIKGK